MATTISQTPYMATNQYGAVPAPAPQIVTQQPVVPAPAAAAAATTTTTTTAAHPMRTTFIGKHWSGFAILLALAATVLYIVAIATPAYWADHDGNGIGLYRSCSVDESGNNQQCSSIDNCRIQLNGLIEHKLPSCDKFRAMQALSVVAVVLAGICCLLMLFSHYRQSRYELSSAILFLSMICGLVLMAIAIDYYIEDIRNDEAVDHFAESLGYSFIIGTVAWVLQLVALCAFSSTHYATRYSTPYATAATAY